MSLPTMDNWETVDFESKDELASSLPVFGPSGGSIYKVRMYIPTTCIQVEKGGEIGEFPTLARPGWPAGKC